MLLCTHLRKIVEKREGQDDQFSVAWRTIHAGQSRSVSSMRHGREDLYLIEEVLRLNEPLPFNV